MFLETALLNGQAHCKVELAGVIFVTQQIIYQIHFEPLQYMDLVVPSELLADEQAVRYSLDGEELDAVGGAGGCGVEGVGVG